MIDKNTTVKNIQVDYYLNKLREYGIYSACGVGWSDYLQVLLFEKLLKVISAQNFNDKPTLLDAGCGVGDLYSYLRNHGYSMIEYTGIDNIPDMINAAEKKYPGVQFKKQDFYNQSFTGVYDYILCSGALNILAARDESGHERYVKTFITKMYTLAAKGCAFNLLAREGKDYFPYNPVFYYADRMKIFEFCSDLCRHVSMDYQEHEYVFTILMNK